MEELSLKDQLELPIVKELLEENAHFRDTATLAGTKIADSKIDKIKVPHIFKNKLVMQEGEHNGIIYEKKDIIDSMPQFEDLDLMYDHMDTKDGKGALAFVGKSRNPEWAISEQGEGVHVDLSVVDKPAAQKLAMGAKWGVSPTIDFERDEMEDGVHGRDLHYKSLSFVTDPAIRATMLNQKKKEVSPMAQDPAKKTVPYKYPTDGSALRKQTEEPKQELASIDVPEDVLALLEKKDTTIAELQEFKDKIELERKTTLSSTLAANEFLIGRVSESELEDRAKELSEKSPDILTELSEVIGEHAELQSFQQFVKDFLRKNPGKTVQDAAIAWNKMKKTGAVQTKENDLDTDEPEAHQLTAPKNPDGTRDLSELANRPNVIPADRDMAKQIAKGFGMSGVL